ncbi:MAG: pseudouridine synthase [Lachnospiraceae bacterium]
MEESIRLNKFLSDRGVCSRREADRMIEAGRITVNQEPVQMGQKVTKKDFICIDGKPISVGGQGEGEEKVVLIFNKPTGVVCTSAESETNNIIHYINYSTRIYPVGRLDKDSEGLILLTNDGSIVNGILRSRYEHEKEYVVTINHPVTDEFLKKMASGVKILDTVTKPCKIWKTGTQTFHIVITQGLNRQIRRMSEACGCKVTKLKRIRIMDIRLGDLKSGEYRLMSESEKAKLYQQIEMEG